MRDQKRPSKNIKDVTPHSEYIPNNTLIHGWLPWPILREAAPRRNYVYGASNPAKRDEVRNAYEALLRHHKSSFKAGNCTVYQVQHCDNCFR